MTITNEQIEALKLEASLHGDREMVAICQRALEGDDDARDACLWVIFDPQR